MASKGLKSPWEPKLVTTTFIYLVSRRRNEKVGAIISGPEIGLLSKMPVNSRRRPAGRQLNYLAAGIWSAGE
jgi:hypothetical protein